MKKVSFEKALYKYFDYCKLNLKDNSYRTVRNRLETHALPYFRNKNIYKIKNNDILNWQLEMNKKGYSLKYKRNLHIALVVFFNFCIKFYNIKQNVASIVGNFKATNELEKIGNIWTIEEFNRFINKVDDIVYCNLFKLLYFSGLRIGEAQALQYKNINFDDHTITINRNMTRFVDANGKRVITTPKTKKSIRTISIDFRMNEELRELQKYYNKKFGYCNEEFFVFGGLKPLANTTIERKKNNWCKLADVKQIKIHEFRHSHACLLFQNDVPVNEISNRLGHASLSMTTDIYLKYLPKKEIKVISTIDFLRSN